MTRRRANDGGFTLLELLVALSIVGLLSLLMFGALRTGSAALARSSLQSSAGSDVGAMQSLLRTTIEQAYPALLPQPDGTRIVSFRGEREALELSAPLGAAAAIGGFMRIKIARRADGDEARLVMAWRVDRNSLRFEELPGPSIEVTLPPDIGPLSFAYFGTPAGAERPQWHSEWQGQINLPRLVRIEAPADAPLAWPTMVVAPRVDVDASCVFDALTRACRGR